ncbi:TIGR04372 family glycosyltransferase [Microcoleus sp. B7-D4]|uniref:TIGR04372 family glycosyltransferase n=1 Tax=Microcoleus sp. B7-D4 TaxID=2818696 RepID=UPI002FD4E08B
MYFFQAANKLKHKGELDQSVASYRSAIKQNPKFYWYHHNLADTLIAMGRWEEAVAAYSRAIELNPSSAWSHYNLGNAWIKLGQWDKAIISYRRAIDLKSNYYGFYNKLGETLYQLAEGLKPQSFLLPEILEKHKQLLAQLLGSQDNQGYVAPLNSLNDEIFLQATEQLTNEKFVEQVYHIYLKREPDVEGKNHYLYHLSNGMTRQVFVTAIRQSEEFQLKLIIELRTIKTYQLDSEKFVSLLEDSTDELFVEEAYHIYLKREPDFEGKHHYLKHLRKGMTRREIVTAFRQGQEFTVKLISSIKAAYLEEAIKAYRRALELSPDSHKLHENLAEALNELGNLVAQQGQFEQAIETYQQAISTSDNNGEDAQYKLAEAHYNQGLALSQHGQFDEAVKSFQAAISLQEDFAEAYYHLGNTWDELNHEDNALEYWERALTLKPDWVHAYIMIGSRFSLRGQRQAWESMMEIAAQAQARMAETCQLHQLKVRFFTPFWTTCIGHIGLIDWYAKMSLLGWRSSNRQILLLRPGQAVANPCFLDYFRPYIDVISDPEIVDRILPLTKYLEDEVYSATLSNGETKVYSELGAAAQKQWELEGRPPLLKLSNSDYERGWDCLQSLGVPKGAWFVALHVRESGFSGHLNYGLGSQDYRDANIDTYLLAIRTIVDRGGWVIRMGDSTTKPLPLMEQVIDYAHSDVKSDWMDVFLCAQCRFFIGMSSGLRLVPIAFGVPCAVTNWTPMGILMPWSSKDIYIPKLYWSQKEQRYLTFAELTAPPIGHVFSHKVLSELGITAVDNTPEEIKDLIVEILERLDDKLKYTEADERLQKQFQTLAEKNQCYSSSRIGRDFLRNYAGLLPSNDGIKMPKMLNSLVHESTNLDRKFPKFIKALKRLQQVSLSQEDENTKSQIAEACYFLGCALDGLEPLNDEAVASWQKALQLRPDWKGAYTQIGFMFWVRGKHEECRKIWKQASERQRELAEVHQAARFGTRFLTAEWSILIGHTACLDYYVKLKMLGLLPNIPAKLLATQDQIANPCYLNYWRPYIEIISDPEKIKTFYPDAQYLEDSLFWLNLADGRTLLYPEAAAIAEKQWEAEERPPLLTLSDSDRERGWNCLHQLGLPKNAWFVCLHVREFGFRGDAGDEDQRYRNADINTYFIAIQSIVARGGWVIRMGDSTTKPLPKMKQVIDYAHSDVKTDWMDVFLCAQCRFFIATCSGLFYPPSTFGVPRVLTNWTPMALALSSSKDIFIPKLYWSKKEQRYLNLSEMLPPSFSYIFSQSYFDFLGIKVADNTADEINAAVVEMLDKLEGKLLQNSTHLPEKFKALVRRYDIHINSEISSYFLRKHIRLL